MIVHQKTEYLAAHQRHIQAGNLKRYPAIFLPGIREKGGHTCLARIVKSQSSNGAKTNPPFLPLPIRVAKSCLAYPFGDCCDNDSYGGQLPMANKKINVDEKRYSDIPVWRRYTLPIEEAAGYYHIGEGKLRMLIDTHPNEDFYVMNGNRVLIKREKFERYLDHATAI